MRAITSIILSFAGTIALIVAARGASSDPEREIDRRPLVVVPSSMNAGVGLQLASYGVARLTTDSGVAIWALHVRAAVANTTRGQPWSLDASAARIELASEQIAPAFVSSTVATLPFAVLDPGERRTIDLYFPLSSDAVERGGPVSFAMTWAMDTPTRIVRTAWFERAAAVAQSGRRADLAGQVLHGWFDPSYAWQTYRHRPGIVTSRLPSYVVLTIPPRWEPMPVDGDARARREAECDQW